MIIWPKHIVSWICALISTDGSIKFRIASDYAKKKYGFNEVINIDICYSAEKNWIKNIQNILRNYKIGTSILTITQKNQWKGNLIYFLCLNKRYPKRKRSGINQFQVLRDNIEYWNLQNLMMKRKYDSLCKFTSLPSKC